MAHEPKLEVFKLKLNPTSKKTLSTYGNFFKNKYGVDDTFTVEAGFIAFFNELLTTISNFYLNPTTKKGLGLEAVDGRTNVSITSNTGQQYIHGTLKGGRYGQNRSIGNIQSPTQSHAQISDTNIVFDTYYFLLYVPFESDKSVLMIQSYSDDSINDIFIGWLSEILKANKFYKPEAFTYCPIRLQEEFKSQSVVKEMTFFHDIVLDEIEDRDSINVEKFSVEIRIKAKEEGVKIDRLDAFISIFNKFGLKRPKTKGTISLEDFNRKVGRLNNGVHQSTFELGGDLEIKPTIYLRDRITLQPDGSPNWDSLHTFATGLLTEILPDVYPEIGFV